MPHWLAPSAIRRAGRESAERLAPAAYTATSDGSASARVPFLFAAFAFSLLLLAAAAVPPSAVSRPRAAELHAEWRAEIAVVALSALSAAGILLLVESLGV